ncbi:Glutathione gamma-glutamylcysteinyltransferase 1 [Linum perenne]
MAMAGLYRRILPSPPAIDFASSEGKQIFLEAVQNGTMEGFFKLVSYFQTQSEPAYCGLASLSMVLNALAIDPRRKWKGTLRNIHDLNAGPWRWFDESMLDCCEPLEKVKAEGISFGKVVCLARCAGAKVEAHRTSQSTIDDFRNHVIRCSSSDNCHVISSYHRGVFEQTGTGHFSPIGGYHAGKDMALILDVARFKYPPHWVPLRLLWEAMDKVDITTGHRRGFILLSRPQTEPGLLYTLSCKQESWSGIAKYLIDEVPMLLKSEDVKDIDRVFDIVVSSLPSDFCDFIKWVAEVRRQEEGGENISQEEKGRLAMKEEILKQVRGTVLFKHVTTLLSSTTPCRNMSTKAKDGDDLSDIATNLCCQGAEILAGTSFQGCSCMETCIKCLKGNDSDDSVTVVSATMVNGGSQQGLEILVPSSEKKQNSCNCGPSNRIYPASSDVLTALLLALPPETWSGIKDEKLLDEVYTLVSSQSLPVLLQEEATATASEGMLEEQGRRRLSLTTLRAAAGLPEGSFIAVSWKRTCNLSKGHTSLFTQLVII